MKSAVISGIILFLIFILVGINTAVVDRMIDETIADTEALGFGEGLAEDFERLSKSYEAHARYINLTVSHAMMSRVEEAFAGIDGAIKSSDEDGFIQAKSRLIDALGQLRRLAGLSIDSII